MRIFTAVRHSADPAFYYGGLWSGNFHPALRALGHDVVESQVDLLPASRFMHIAGGFTRGETAVRADLTSRIVDEITREHRKRPIDAFLSYFYNAHFDPSAFVDIHRLGIPTINFYCNSLYQFELVAAIAPNVSFAWHAEKAAAPLYRAAGATPVWVQMAADPDVYRPTPGTTRAARTCFVGQRYSDRDRWLGGLIRSGVPLDIYGPGWQRTNGTGQADHTSRTSLGRREPAPGSPTSYLQAVARNVRRDGLVGGAVRTWRQASYRRETRQLAPTFWEHARGPIPFEQIRDVFGRYQVVVNASNVWADGAPGSRLIPHVRLRDFEAPMCGACYLTGDTEEIREFYEVGREIETYQSPEEFVAKARFYLAHPDAAERMRQAGYCRARRDHTWQRRFEQLFRETGIRA